MMRREINIPQSAVERARDIFKGKVEKMIREDPRLKKQFKKLNWRQMDKILFSAWQIPTVFDKDGNKVDLTEEIKRRGLHTRVIPIYGLAAILGLKIIEVDGTHKVVPFIHWFDDIPFLSVDAEEDVPRQLYIVGGNYKVTKHGIEG